MPPARPPIAPQTPCDLLPEQSIFIREAAHRVFGDDVVVRNYGTDADALRIHVETSRSDCVTADFIGILLTRLDHVPSVSVTQRGAKIHGDAKVAYRQGKVL